MDPEELRLYGLPVFTSKWLPDTFLVSGRSFGKEMASEDFRHLVQGGFADGPAYRASDQTYLVDGRRVTKHTLVAWAHAQMEADRRMGKFNRPYEGMSYEQLAQEMSKQLAAGRVVDATAFGDANKNYLVSTNTTTNTTNPYGWSLTSDPLWGNARSSMPKAQNVETTFRVGADGRPEAVTRLVDEKPKGAVRNGGETDLAWLKRRVDEICWKPA